MEFILGVLLPVSVASVVSLLTGMFLATRYITDKYYLLRKSDVGPEPSRKAVKK